MMAVDLLVAALFGFGVLGWYDRKGLHRIPAEPKPGKTVVPAWQNATHPGRRHGLRGLRVSARLCAASDIAATHAGNRSVFILLEWS